MGYRSDVTIFCEEKIYEEIKKSMSAFTYDDGSHMKAHEVQMRTNSDGTKDYLMKWFDVKWYGSYEDVQSVENVLDKYEDDGKVGYRYHKIEVGEDNETTESCNDWDWGDELYATVEVPDPSGMEVIE